MCLHIDVNTQNRTSAGSFGKTPVADMLWSMSTLAERVAHAMKLRDLSQSDVDRQLAERLGKKGRSSGYMTRVLKRGQRPRAEHLTALAEILQVADAWLLRGEGAIERGAEPAAVPTYDSLPGWAAAAAEELRRRRVADYAIRAAGRSPASVRPKQITPEFVFRAAMFWLEHSPEEEREAVMLAEAQRIKATEDPRQK